MFPSQQSAWTAAGSRTSGAGNVELAVPSVLNSSFLENFCSTIGSIPSLGLVSTTLSILPDDLCRL